MTATLRIATRGSPLAIVQARLVAAALTAHDAGTRVELVIVETRGDRQADLPIHAIGGQGVFVKDVERAVLDGRADAAVHSAKDLPSGPGPLAIAAIPPRSDPRDAIVGRPLARLGPGSKVATGSVRRRAQLAWLRPDLTFTQLRGNMATRLAKIPAGGAIVVAAAALLRLGLLHEAAEILEPIEMLPQVGQGALAVCCRPDDAGTLAMLAPLDDVASSGAVRAERAFLGEIGGGCELPVGAYAEVRGAEIRLEGLIASHDGHTLVRRSRAGRLPGAGPEETGAALAAEMLDRWGGAVLLGQGDAAAMR